MFTNKLSNDEIVTVENLKRSDVKHLFESTDSPAASRVIEAFYSLLGLSEEQEKQEFKNKVSSGVIYYFANYLNELSLANISSSNIKNAKKLLEGLSQESVGVENKAALALRNWIQKTIDGLRLEEAPADEIKEESKLNEVQDCTNIEIDDHREQDLIKSPSTSCGWESLNFTWPQKEVNESLSDYIARNSNDRYSISKAAINELTSLRAPPATVANVASACNIILGDKDLSWNGFIKNKSTLLSRILNLDVSCMTAKTCKKVQKLLEGVTEEDVKCKSLACYHLYLFVVTLIQQRIAIGLYGNLEVDRKCMTSSVPRRKKAKKSPNKSEVKVEHTPDLGASIPYSEGFSTFARVVDETKSPASESVEVVETPFSYLSYYDLPGYDWRLFRRDSPIRRRILRDASDKYKVEYEKLARNSIQSQAKVLEKVNKDPFYGSYSYKLSDFPDLNYQRHKQDVMIDTAIQKERMNPDNINKAKSRVSYHWSPKRRREMKKESDYMTGYYTERFIRDVIKDIHDRRITINEGEDCLKDFGYNLEVEKNQATGDQEIRAVITEEVKEPETKQEASPVQANEDTAKQDNTEENCKTILRKELALGRELLKKASLNISEESLLDLASDNYLSYADEQITRVFVELLELINLGKCFYYSTSSNLRQELRYSRDWIHRIDDFEYMIERYSYPEYKIDELRQRFTRNSSEVSTKPYITNIREYLCEAFCLIDIISEIRGDKKLPIKVPVVSEGRVTLNTDEIINKIIQESKSQTREPKPDAIKKEEVKETIKVEIADESKAAEVAVESSLPKEEILTIPIEEQTIKEIRRNVVHSRSPVRATKKTVEKKLGKTITTKTTTYYMASSPKKTVIEKIVTTKPVSSPTKRVIDMKNASLKHKTNASKASGTHGKMLYTIDPKNAYLVEKEFPMEFTSNQIIAKTIEGGRGFVEATVDEDGNLVNKYYFKSPYVQQVKKDGKLVDVTREFEVSPTKRTWVQEFIQDKHVDEIVSPSRLESRKDVIRRIEERTRGLLGNAASSSGFDAEFPSTYQTDRADKYNQILRQSVTKTIQ